MCVAVDERVLLFVRVDDRVAAGDGTIDNGGECVRVDERDVVADFEAVRLNDCP